MQIESAATALEVWPHPKDTDQHWKLFNLHNGVLDDARISRKFNLEKPLQINELNPQQARAYFCRTTSYFDMELPPYFNFQPLLEHSLSEAEDIDMKDLFGWKPEQAEGLNYVLMYNKDGDIGWRPFELMHPLLYAKCVDVLTTEKNWKFVQDRLKTFSGGVVELDLSRFSAAPSARLSHLAFESDRAFPT